MINQTDNLTDNQPKNKVDITIDISEDIEQNNEDYNQDEEYHSGDESEISEEIIIPEIKDDKEQFKDDKEELKEELEKLKNQVEKFKKEEIKNNNQQKDDTPRSSVISDISDSTDDIDSKNNLDDSQHYHYNSKKKKCSFLGCVFKRTNKETHIDDDNDYILEEPLYTDKDDGDVKNNEWTSQRKHHFQKCLWKLKYNRVVSDVYLNNIKKEEENWSWGLIVLSTLTSGLTVANNVEEEPFEYYDITINIALTFMSMLTSFCAAWIKKKNYVDKINFIDKYLLNINSLCEKLEVQFSILDSDRLRYDKFKKIYMDQITDILSTSPIIPPDEWKRCIQEITLQYPELINPDNSEENKLWPWFGDMVKLTRRNGKTEIKRKKTAFMDQMRTTRSERLKSSCCFDVRSEKDIYD